MSFFVCSSCHKQFGVSTGNGATHCLNAACTTNSPTKNRTLGEILKIAETCCTVSPKHENLPRGRVEPWSPHSLHDFAKVRAEQLRLIEEYGTDDPIDSTQQKTGKRRPRKKARQQNTGKRQSSAR